MKKINAVALLALLLLLNVVVSGCISEEEPKEKVSWLSLLGSSHNIYAGNSTTYIILVVNEQTENDTITLSIVSQPSDWDVTLNQTTIFLTKQGSFGIFGRVSAPADAKKGSYKIQVEATSEVDGRSTTLTITTKVIENNGERIKEGDKVEVDYLGYFPDYRIFDTSISDIGYNTAVRKTDDFNPGKQYAPLKVLVGPTDTDNSDAYINTVEGFWEGMVGMKVGQSRTVVVPPSKGYGIYENATLNITEDVSMIEIMSFGDFEANYPDQQPLVDMPMSHHFWKWNVSIGYANESEDVIMITHEPDLNQMITPYGWESKVIYKNQSDNDGEGRITLVHGVQAGNKAIYQGFQGSVKSVENGTINLEYNVNIELIGTQDLMFELIVIKISD